MSTKANKYFYYTYIPFKNFRFNRSTPSSASEGLQMLIYMKWFFLILAHLLWFKIYVFKFRPNVSWLSFIRLQFKEKLDCTNNCRFVSIFLAIFQLELHGSKVLGYNLVLKSKNQLCSNNHTRVFTMHSQIEWLPSHSRTLYRTISTV